MSVASGDTLHFRINHAMDVLQLVVKDRQHKAGISQADATKKSLSSFRN
jgi:hypothetical protein